MSLSERSKGFVGLFAVSCLAFGLVTGAAPQQPSTSAMPPDVQKVGPQVGTRVPDFSRH